MGQRRRGHRLLCVALVRTGVRHMLSRAWRVRGVVRQGWIRSVCWIHNKGGVEHCVRGRLELRHFEFMPFPRYCDVHPVDNRYLALHGQHPAAADGIERLLHGNLYASYFASKKTMRLLFTGIVADLSIRESERCDVDYVGKSGGRVMEWIDQACKNTPIDLPT